jgi:hypothetical protein
MHIEANLLNCKGNVWTGEGQVLKGSCQAAVLSGVSNGRSICRKFGVEINRRAARLARTHPGSLQNILSVLSLGEKQTMCRACNRNPQEMMKLTHVCHSKIMLKSPNDMAKKLNRRSSEDNIINIEQQISSV